MFLYFSNLYLTLEDAAAAIFSIHEQRYVSCLVIFLFTNMSNFNQENKTSTHKEASENRRAFITGGSSGIGRSIASKFADAGFVTTIADIETPQDFNGYFFPVDLKHSEEADSLYGKLMDTMGMPDVLVLNAGRGVHEKLTEGNPDTWEQIFRLNVFSALRLIRAFVPGMLRQERGDIIFISSVSSRHAYPYGGIYAATKAAIDTLAETLRLEVQPSIRVTTLHPGVVDTNFFGSMINGSQTPESIGWGALHPDQVADAVLYAVSQPAGVALNDIVIRPVAQPM